ncbi:hypothetical protein UFOVP482_19 [uncultured Caudovirales phage]|uniref:Uncharacterized protein n=1 Tax=uncultured Caudovirales phage TaxID=2100421 RepID=A0A6J5MQB5_9CAUD|nr:hypothetical protein UFOVP482_19 [uncultured Caudovirales phage]
MDMANDKITIKPDLSDYRGLLKAISQMDKESQTSLKSDVQSISAWTAQGMSYAAYGAPMARQAVIVGSTIRANKDRVPNVTIGGSKGRASGGANSGQLLFGNEFGSDRNLKGSAGSFPNGGYRFPDRSPREGRGNSGYWIFPTLKAMQPEIRRRWFNAIEKVLDNWARTS